MFPSGKLVVAKLKRYPPWPSIVAPASNQATQKIVKKIHFTHVVFLEYLNQHAWVPTKNITAFTSSDEFKNSGFGVRAAAGTAARMSSMSEEERFALLNSASSGIRTEDGALKTTRCPKRNADQGTYIGKSKKNDNSEEERLDDQENRNGNEDDEVMSNVKKTAKMNDKQQNSGSSGIRTEDGALKTTRRLKRNAVQGTYIGKSKKNDNSEEERNDDQENGNGNKDDEVVTKVKKTAKMNDKQQNSGSSGIRTEDGALKTTRRLKRNAVQGTYIGKSKKTDNSEEERNDDQENRNGNKDDEVVTKVKKTAKMSFSKDFTMSRRNRCGDCDGCRAPNCVSCHYCRDMIKFGGQGKMKQACVNRVCLTRKRGETSAKNPPACTDDANSQDVEMSLRGMTSESVVKTNETSVGFQSLDDSQTDNLDDSQTENLEHSVSEDSRQYKKINAQTGRVKQENICKYDATCEEFTAKYGKGKQIGEISSLASPNSTKKNASSRKKTSIAVLDKGDECSVAVFQNRPNKMKKIEERIDHAIEDIPRNDLIIKITGFSITRTICTPCSQKR